MQHTNAIREGNEPSRDRPDTFKMMSSGWEEKRVRENELISVGRSSKGYMAEGRGEGIMEKDHRGGKGHSGEESTVKDQRGGEGTQGERK